MSTNNLIDRKKMIKYMIETNKMHNTGYTSEYDDIIILIFKNYNNYSKKIIHNIISNILNKKKFGNDEPTKLKYIISKIFEGILNNIGLTLTYYDTLIFIIDKIYLFGKLEDDNRKDIIKNIQKNVNIIENNCGNNIFCKKDILYIVKYINLYEINNNIENIPTAETHLPGKFTSNSGSNSGSNNGSNNGSMSGSKTRSKYESNSGLNSESNNGSKTESNYESNFELNSESNYESNFELNSGSNNGSNNGSMSGSKTRSKYESNSGLNSESNNGSKTELKTGLNSKLKSKFQFSKDKTYEQNIFELQEKNGIKIPNLKFFNNCTNKNKNNIIKCITDHYNNTNKSPEIQKEYYKLLLYYIGLDPNKEYNIEEIKKQKNKLMVLFNLHPNKKDNPLELEKLINILNNLEILLKPPVPNNLFSINAINNLKTDTNNYYNEIANYYQGLKKSYRNYDPGYTIKIKKLNEDFRKRINNNKERFRLKFLKDLNINNNIDVNNSSIKEQYNKQLSNYNNEILELYNLKYKLKYKFSNTEEEKKGINKKIEEIDEKINKLENNIDKINAALKGLQIIYNFT